MNEARNLLRMNPRHHAIEVIALMIGTLLSTETAYAGGGPVWPSRVTYRALQVDRIDWPAAWEQFDDDAWLTAARIGGFFAMGAPEGDARRTEIRMLQSKGALLIFARCHDDQPEKIKAGQGTGDPSQEDSLELLIAQGSQRDYPLLHIELSAAGRCKVTRELVPTAMWGEVVSETIDLSLVKARASACKQGWWAAIELPLEKLGVPQDKFRMNILRNRLADDTRFAWADLWGGRLRNVFRMGTVEIVAARPEVPPSIELPVTLSVGGNVLKVLDWRQGLVFKVNGKPAAVDAKGQAVVDIAQYGPTEISVQTASGPTTGEELARYACDVPRPLIVQAQAAFGGELDKPIALDVILDIAKGAKATVTVEALQDGKQVAHATVILEAGTHRVDLALKDAKAGEIQLMASGELAMPGGKVQLAARHWCMAGVQAMQVDRFRDGIEKLPTQALLRAAVSDAGNYWRLAQTGSGIFSRGRGDPIWPQGITYLMAILYKSNWPENPHFKDERFLASAAAGMEAALDPPSRQKWLNEPDNRSLQGFLMTYELLKDDVPPAQAGRWKAALTEIVESVVEIWIRPAEYRFARYSYDVGVGTNHWAFHAANVYTAGRVLARKDWLDLGRREMLKLAGQERDGQFAERRGVPTLLYNWLTQTALAEYFLQSSDNEVAAAVRRCAEFACRTSLPDGGQLTLHDGRVNSGWRTTQFPLPLIFTLEGRQLARTSILEQVAGRPPSKTNPQVWYRMGEMALALPGGAEAPLAAEDEFAFMDGLALVAKRKGFCYGLSAICLPPIKDLYRLDPQNAVELHHAKAGFILLGNNSQDQPEAGSFYRKIGNRAVWLPSMGRIIRTAGGHAVTLTYDSFKVSLLVKILSEDSAEIKVELLEAQGDEPVVFSFFPAGPDATLGEGGRKIQFGQTTITASSPVEMQKGFKIYNPYSGKYATSIKPIRAFAALDKSRPLVLTVNVNKNVR